MRKIIASISLLILMGISVLAQVSYKPVILPDVPAAPPVPKVQQKSSSAGESNIYLGFSLMPGIRLGGFKDSVKSGIDVLVSGEYFINENISAGLETGLMYFKTDPVNLGVGKQTFIPIALKATYFFKEQPFRPYGALSIGYYVSKRDYSFMSAPYFDPVSGTTVPGKETPRSLNMSCLGVSPMFGFYYDIDEQFAANFGAQFFFLFPKGGASNSMGIKFGVIYKL
ncbi:MAG: hypothetical protein WCO63_12435 [Bacteroidota bacterium]